MDAYSAFAQVYDLFMDNVPYDRWCGFIDSVLKEYGMEENILLDLGCGTGTMTRIMSDLGYDMIGVDNSPEMLDIAREIEYDRQDAALWEAEESQAEDSKAREVQEEEEKGADSLDETAEADEANDAAGTEEPEMAAGAEEPDTASGTQEPDTAANRPVAGEISPMEDEEYYDCAYSGEKTPTMYLCQDMRELELYGTIGACYCSCNSINYILDREDLKKVFSLVNNYLFPKGLFIFDINTVYKYETLMADNTIAENRPEGSFIWENSYDPENRINIYDLTLYIRGDLCGAYEPEPDGKGRAEEDSAEEGRAEEDSAYETAADEIDADTETSVYEEMPYIRCRETHVQKAWSLEEIMKLLEEAGMEFIGAYDNYTKQPVRADSEIITIIAREQGK